MKTEIIQFRNASLLVEVDENGTPWVAVKPIIDAIGLHADSALRGIKNDEILGSVHAVRRVRDAHNRGNDMVCLPIEHVHGWLFGIDASKVNQEAREALLAYKRECYRVLFEHFYGMGQTLRKSAQVRCELTQRLHKVNGSIRDLMAEQKDIRRQLRQIDRKDWNQLGLWTDEQDALLEEPSDTQFLTPLPMN